METLVDGQTCFVTRGDGELTTVDGLYHLDTRYLSALDVTFDDTELALVASEGSAAGRRTLLYLNRAATGDVTTIPDGSDRPPGNLVVRRDQAIAHGTLHERVTVTNHSAARVAGTVAVTFDVDFADVFEVRGVETGIDRTIEVDAGDRAVTYRYDYTGADGDEIRLVSTVGFGQPAETLQPGRATFALDLAPQDSETYAFAVHPGGADETVNDPFGAGPAGDTDADDGCTDTGGITTGSPEYDRTFARAAADLAALTTQTQHGPVPVTGVPWFATVFGRDSLIAAYQTLPVAPSLARGTLRYLAANQGTQSVDYRDEQPGKILHEVRRGELARRRLIPHTPYYGTVDATPLWVILLHETHRWLDDPALIEEHWDDLERALAWIDTAVAEHGDDPFLYYDAGTDDGLLHKAWRDTAGSVQFADGESADPPLASVEVQGYVYDAFRRAASLYRHVRSDENRASDLDRRADRLQTAFDAMFWLPEREFYGAAMTADGRVADSLTSNVGQCLWTGIVPAERVDTVVDRLLSPELFSGWGIRTMSTTAHGYRPLSYHIGSVWPHDTALCALGLARYDQFDAVETVADGLLSATTRFEHNRVPELFGGFDDTISPIEYEASCAPQAWAAGAPFALLRALFDADPGHDGVTIGRRPTAIAADAIQPIVEAWRDDGPAGLWHPGEEQFAHGQ